MEIKYKFKDLIVNNEILHIFLNQKYVEFFIKSREIFST